MASSSAVDPYNSMDWTATPPGGASPVYDKRSSADEAALWLRRWLLGVSMKSHLISIWVKYDRAYQAEFMETARPSWRPDVVLNYIFESIEDHRAQISAMKLEPMLRPIVPMQPRSLSLVQGSIKHLYNRLRMHHLLDIGTFYALLYGTAVWRVAWNPDSRPGTISAYDRVIGIQDAAEPFRNPDGTPILDPEGNPLTSALFKGDVDISVRHPANFFVQPGAYDLQFARWCLEAEPIPVEQAAEEFPDYKDKIMHNSTFMYTEPFYRPTVLQTIPTGDKGYVYRLLCWEKHPERGLIKRVIIGNQLVDEQDHFYDDGHYPYAIQRHYHIPKQFWGMSIAQQIYNLNKAINKLVELIMMNGMLMANSQKILHAASGINPLSITNEPGKIYPTNFDPNNTLVPIRNEPVHQYVFEIINMAKTALSEVAGRFTAPPSGIRAAAAIIALLERMSARTRREADAGPAEALRETTILTIHRMRQFYTEARLFPFYGEDGSVQFEALRLGDVLRPLDFSVEIDSVAGQPISKALLVEKMTAFNKLFPGAMKPSEGAELLELPAYITERIRKEEATQQAMQNLTMGLGSGLPPQGGEQMPSQMPGQMPGMGMAAQGPAPEQEGLTVNPLGSPGPTQHILETLPEVARQQ